MSRSDDLQRAMQAMARYGENQWWKSDDARTLAYYQLNEDTLLIPFSRFHGALENLLGREVQTFEFAVNIEGLRAEAKAAYDGIPYSAEGQSHAMRQSWDRLVEMRGRENIIVIREDEL